MIIIKNANLVSMEEINYKLSDIAIENGKFIKLGRVNEKEFPNAIIIDAKELLVTPGIVDPHCHIGLIESTIGWAGSDGNEITNPIYPELRGIDSVKPQDPCFQEALNSGVTTVCCGPGSANIIGGTFCALKTKGKTVNEMVLKEEIAMKMALGENPKRCYGNSNRNPATRMASAALMREWLFKAKDYHDKKQKYLKDLNNNPDIAKKPEFNMKLESLSRVFDGMLVKIHAHQSDDIFTAIRIIKEFNLNATIDHCTEGYLFPEVLKEYNQNCIIGPVFGNKSKYELKHKSFDSAKILHDNGIEFAIMTDHPVIPLSNTLTQASLFRKAGLSEFDTLKALTLSAAKLCQIDDRVGSIKVGKDADLVIWSGDPFHYLTEANVVILNGKIEKNIM